VVQRFLRSSGPLQISRTSTDLVEVLSRAVVVAETEARRRDVTLMVQAPGKLSCDIDGSLVRRALENLMLNAIEFAALGPPGQVTVAVLPRGKSALLIVEDDGPGVPTDDRTRIFQAYFSTKPGGTGLGLALVKQVFDAHGGSIRCEQAQQGGARFEATLPLLSPGA
jgi:two-component system sensor histidine kinase HydH